MIETGVLYIGVFIALMFFHQILPCGTCGLRYQQCRCPNKRTELH
jgi:hypothetical protein